MSAILITEPCISNAGETLLRRIITNAKKDTGGVDNIIKTEREFLGNRNRGNAIIGSVGLELAERSVFAMQRDKGREEREQYR